VGRGCGVPDRTGRAAAVRTPEAEEDSPGYALRSHAEAVGAAGMRRRGCSRSLARGLDPDRSNPGLTCCSWM